MATKYLTAFIACLLAGCATCERHPTACKAAAAVIVMGTVVALDHRRADQATPVKPACDNSSCLRGIRF